jgi:hypothetical protein
MLQPEVVDIADLTMAQLVCHIARMNVSDHQRRKNMTRQFGQSPAIRYSTRSRI